MRSGCYLFAVRKSRWIRRRLKSIRDEMGDTTNRWLLMLLWADEQTQQAMLGGNHVWQHLYIIYLTYWLTNSNTVRTSMRLTHARAARTRCTHLLDDAERAAAGLRLHHAANRATWAEQQLHQTVNTQTQGRVQLQLRVTKGSGGGGGLFKSLAVVKQSGCRTTPKDYNLLQFHDVLDTAKSLYLFVRLYSTFCTVSKLHDIVHCTCIFWTWGDGGVVDTSFTSSSLRVWPGPFSPQTPTTQPLPGQLLSLLYLILCRSFMILNPESTFDHKITKFYPFRPQTAHTQCALIKYMHTKLKH